MTGSTSTTTDWGAVKGRMKATWEAGDYATFATYMEPGAVDLLEAWEVEPGSRLLDVACGAGQIAIPAARAGLSARGVDLADNLVSAARERAFREGLAAEFDQGDAEALPYPDGSFDVVASLFGAMFAPRPERVASELLRVCRPGGRVLMGNWTPESFPAHMFRVIASRVPAPADVPSPLGWGREEVVRERLAEASEVRTETRRYTRWEYPFPVGDVVSFFEQHFGPIVRAHSKLDESERQSMREELLEVFSRFDRGKDGQTMLDGEFLSVDAIR